MQLISPVPHKDRCEECRCEACRYKECRCEACKPKDDQCEACQREDECRRSVRVSLSSLLNTLCSTASLEILRDELLLYHLYISLQIALSHDWEPDPYELRLLEVCRLDDPDLGPLERCFYRDGGGDKAVLALYREALDDKRFFTGFDALSRRAQESLISLTNGLSINEALESRLYEIEKPARKMSIHLTILYLTRP
jgi:hypothetical protein